MPDIHIMGLDQYLFKHETPVETAYWRKQPWLDKYMYDLWDDRTDNSLNCQRLTLSYNDIQTILDKLKDPNSDIHPDDDFLDENQEWHAKELKRTITHFEHALADTQSGQQIYYTNWW